MIIIRIESDNRVIILDEETAIDTNDYLEIETEFDTLTIADCLNTFKKFKKSIDKL